MTSQLTSALVLAAALVSAASSSFTPPSLQQFEFEQPHMGTLFRIVLYAPDEAAARDASDLAFARIAELDARFSDYRTGSELSAVVREAWNAPVAVSADLYEVLHLAQAFAERTGGAFDVTAGALTHLWRRARRQSELPDANEVAAARDVSGHRLMHLDATDRAVRFERRGVRLDLGGIGKGYAADRALDALRATGVGRALVAAGGDIAAGEPPPGSDGWTVGVLGWDGRPSPIVLSRAAISTSGDREQWLEVAGVRYSHIVDPRTGEALTERRLVSAMAPDAATSDMLATAASVLETEEAICLADGIPGAAVRIGTAGEAGGVRWRVSSRWPE